MENEKLLVQILNKLTSIEYDITDMKLNIKEIKFAQSEYAKQLDSLQNRPVENNELKSAIDKLVKDIEKLENDNTLIKRVLAN